MSLLHGMSCIRDEPPGGMEQPHTGGILWQMSVILSTSGTVHLLTVDDGHRNTITVEVAHEMVDALRSAQDHAQALVLAGRPDFYSEGLDQEVFRAGGQPASDLLHGATELILRLVEFPRPVVTACTGTAVGAASICLLACDYRIGAAGNYKIGMDYVAVGMEVPELAIELARSRLSPRHMTLACNTAQLYSPGEAVEAGFLDTVTTGDPVAQACKVAEDLAERVDIQAFEATRSITCRGFADAIIRSAGDLWRMQRDS